MLYPDRKSEEEVMLRTQRRIRNREVPGRDRGRRSGDADLHEA